MKMTKEYMTTKELIHKITSSPFYLVYDEPPAGDPPAGDPPAGDPPAGDPPAGDPPAGDPPAGTFTQDQVNKMLAEDKRRHQQTSKKMMDELDALRAKSTMSVKDREETDLRIEKLQNELLTKEELAAKERTKSQSAHELAVTELTSDRDGWKTRYHKESISRALTDAAVVNEAFVPEQIVAILQPTTTLEEALDEHGNPTGVLDSKVAFADMNKDGDPVTLSLNVPEAVKRMTEMDKYLNLFKGLGTGGVGGQTRKTGTTGAIDVKEVSKDPELYRKLRKEGKI